MEAIVYMIFVVAAGLSQRSYFDSLAERSNAVISLHSAARELQDRPSGLIGLVVFRTTQYLRALSTRQEDPDLEFKRLRAVAMIAVMLFVFIVFVAL